MIMMMMMMIIMMMMMMIHAVQNISIFRCILKAFCTRLFVIRQITSIDKRQMSVTTALTVTLLGKMRIDETVNE